ncbi:OmpH family outer membrane protein [Pelagibacteraceae bacterium]|nr:OmpH family outer membrane protein [Pelagibacteraceae bacterium]
MKHLKIIFAVILFSTLSINFLQASDPHFIDFTKVLNQSIAGKKAQEDLRKKFDQENQKFTKIEKVIREEEKTLINQKKLITPEEYKKKVQALRKKVDSLQKNKQKSLNNLTKSKNNAKTQLLKSLNPIIKKYMEDNKIRVVLDKKSILLADTKLEITKQVIDILNKELKSLNIK